MAKDLPPADERLRHHISSANDQDVEDVIDQRRTSGSMILEQVEGRPTALVKGNDFTVNYVSSGIAERAFKMAGYRALKSLSFRDLSFTLPPVLIARALYPSSFSS
jgi:hypothetical protein